MPRLRHQQRCADFELGKDGRRVYPHRCMQPHGRGRGRKKCLARMTFDHWGDHPRCPSCGSRFHWAIDKWEAMRIDKKTCKSGSCPYDYPHSIYSEHCAFNPKMPSDSFGMADTPAVKSDGDDPGW